MDIERLCVTIGAPLGRFDQVCDLGPEHPSRSGLVRFDLTVAHGVIRTVRIDPGAIHRGAEKLFEVRDPRQILALANRHDWQSPLTGELGAVLTFEASLGLVPPPRATWLRTLLSEHSRLASHLAFLTYVPSRLAPDAGLSARIAQLRAALRDQVQALSGNRVHPMLMRLGGLVTDADEAWIQAEVDLARRVGELGGVLGEVIAQATPAGVAPIGTELIASHGLSGPTARAAGVDTDVRRLAPYIAYGSLTISPDPPADGDARARLAVLAADLPAAACLVERCAAALEPGEVSTKLPKIVKLPEGDTYTEIESPLGRSGYFLVSRGEKTPWRVRLRTPSFANMAALENALPGTQLQHLGLAVASVGYVVGDVAK